MVAGMMGDGRCAGSSSWAWKQMAAQEDMQLFGRDPLNPVLTPQLHPHSSLPFDDLTSDYC